MTRKLNRKPKFTDAERARLASITEQLQNPESSLSEQAKALLRRESLEIHKSEERREQLRIEQKVAAKKTEPKQKQEPPNKFLIIPPSRRSQSATATWMFTEKKSKCGNWHLTNKRRKRFSILPSTVLCRATVPIARFANALKDAMNLSRIFCSGRRAPDALERLCRDFSECGRALLCRAGTISRLRKTPSEVARIWSRVSFVAEPLQVHGLSRR